MARTRLTLLTAALLIVGLGSSALVAQPSSSISHACSIAADDEHWLRDALRNWPIVLRKHLKTADRPHPLIFAYDDKCVVTVEPSGRWASVWHEGKISLPSGAEIPPAPNASNGAGDEGNFVVMSLPSIWRATGVKTDIALGHFLEAVFLHELAHSYQSAVSPSMSFPAIHKRYDLPDNISDDSVQERFEGDPLYVQVYEAERDLLLRAATAPTDAEARSLTCKALATLRERRSRYLADGPVAWPVIDELSLTTEGLGQWIGYTWLTKERRLDPALVLRKMRGSFWSQDEGLALFLVIDRLVPDWQSRLFRVDPETAEPMLVRACGS